MSDTSSCFSIDLTFSSITGVEYILSNLVFFILVKFSLISCLTLSLITSSLIISLKRFNPNGTKNMNTIEFPINDLNLEKYVFNSEKKSVIIHYLL